MIEVRVRGLPDLKAALLGLTPALRRRAIRNALSAAARVVRDEARRVVPVLQPALRSPYRRPGTLKRAISVRPSKIARRAGDIGVFVNVRPAKRGLRGAKVPTDPFYWRFVEFGTRKMAARPFLQPAARKLPEALVVFQRSLGPQIQKLERRPPAAPR